MNLVEMYERVVRKIIYFTFKILSRDRITMNRIKPIPDMSHIGTEYGGFVIPMGLLKENSVCYCVGCGEDISFDLGLIKEFGCHVYGFDPTPRAIKYVRKMTMQQKKYHFFDIGLWDTDDSLKFYAPKNPDHVSHSALNLQKTNEYFDARVKRLSQIMHENRHEELNLLKIDVEGAEYRVIRSIIDDNIKISVLCVEYDECFNPMDGDYRKRIKESVNSIISFGYTLVCAERNGNYTFVRNAR